MHSLAHFMAELILGMRCGNKFHFKNNLNYLCKMFLKCCETSNSTFLHCLSLPIFSLTFEPLKASIECVYSNFSNHSCSNMTNCTAKCVLL